MITHVLLITLLVVLLVLLWCDRMNILSVIDDLDQQLKHRPLSTPCYSIDISDASHAVQREIVKQALNSAEVEFNDRATTKSLVDLLCSAGIAVNGEHARGY